MFINLRILHLLSCAILLSSGIVHAEEQQAPQVRALNSRVIAEINANLQCSTAAITLHDQLAAAQAEVKRLTDKYEPKKVEMPK